MSDDAEVTKRGFLEDPTGFMKDQVMSLYNLFTQPLEPSYLAISIVVGLFGGIFPVPGITTGVVGVLAIIFRLLGVSVHVPIATAVNLLMTVPDFLLTIPFIFFGCFLTGTERPPITPEQLQDSFKTLGMLATFRRYSVSLALGVFGWVVVAVPVGAVLYFAIRNVTAALRRRSSSHDKPVRSGSI